MKKLLILSFTLTALILSSCQQEIPAGDPNAPQDVTFNIGNEEGGFKAGQDCSLDAHYAMVTISIGNEIENFYPPTFYVDGVLYTQAIKMPPGDYILEEFVLFNDAGTPDDKQDDVIVSAAPHAGSEYGDQIPNPLDIYFTVSPFSKMEVPVGVFCFQETEYQEFGFVWFKPNLTIQREMHFFGDFCSPEFNTYAGSLYGDYPKVDMPAIFKIEFSQDTDGDQIYETDLGTYNNEEGYYNDADIASVPPLSIRYLDQPDVDDFYKMDVYIYELVEIVPETGEAIFDYKYFESWYFTNDSEIMYKAVEYRDDITGLESVGPGTDGIYDFIVGPCIVIEWDIELDDPDFGDEEETETAYAYYNETSSTCFLDIGFSRWGWTNELENSFGTTYELPIWAAAGQCDRTKGTHVGTLVVEIHDGNTATITYTMFDGYTLEETQLYVGEEILPLNNGNYTVSSGQFPYINEDLDGASSDEYTVDIPSGNSFNLVAHSVVVGLH
ncbi:MAG: hypothetical protein U9N86_16925 [Bacteroidota bacterium]|nr:hypothetical protein [Bacteroidota bacterium]